MLSISLLALTCLSTAAQDPPAPIEPPLEPPAREQQVEPAEPAAQEPEAPAPEPAPEAEPAASQPAAPTDAEPDAPRIALTDLARLRQVVEIELATDGALAVLQVREVHGDPAARDEDVETGYRDHLELLRRGAEGSRRLTFGERGGYDPAIAPDGKQLAFLRAGEGESEERGAGELQVWLLPLEHPGEARQLTRIQGGVRNPRWLPHGGALLVDHALEIRKLEGPSPFDRERPGRALEEPGDGAAADPQSSEAQPGEDGPSDPEGGLAELRVWLAAGRGERDPDVFHRIDFQGEQGLRGPDEIGQLWRIDAQSGVPHELTRGWLDASGGRLSPDGRRVAFAAKALDDALHPDRVLRDALYLVELSGGAPRELFSDPALSIEEFTWSDDGAELFACVSDTSEPTFALAKLVALQLDGSEPRALLPEFEEGVFDLEQSGGVLTFRANHRGQVRLHGLDLESGAQRPIIDVPGAVMAYALGADGSVLYALSDAANPCEVYRLESGADDVRLTDLHASWLAPYELAPALPGEVARPGEAPVQYWRMPALGLAEGERAPVVLEMHGGPHVMWGPGSFTMWHEFQLLCARGYTVIYANPRGSRGYGYAFAKGNRRDWGSGPASDVLAALDAALAESPEADPERLFLTGGSYAGYLTAWIVSQDARFDAAAAQRGVYDLATFFGEGNAFRLVEWSFGGLPWQTEVRALLDAQSPFTHVESIHTPLLIMHASADLRTGVSQSEMLYRALKSLQRPVEYVRYPTAGHDLSRTGDPRQRVDRLGRILEFFARYGGRN